MNKKILLLLALLLAMAVAFVACDNASEPTDETTVATDAPTEPATDAPTEEPTDAPTEEPTDAPTEEPTDAPTEAPTDAPTEAPTDAPTDAPTEAPTEEPETEPQVPHYDNYNVPQDQWTVTGHCPGLVGSEGHGNSGMVAAGGVESGALLHQGSIYLGEIDLSIYEKVVIMWGCDNSPVTVGHYEQSANNRIMLVSAEVNGTAPAEGTVIAGGTYELHGWAVQAFEIDLTEIDYNGPVYVCIDTLPGTFALFSSVEFIGAEIPEGAETPEVVEPYTVDLSTVTATGNYPTVDVPVPGSVFGTDHCFALHYGSINLGEIDLSRYSKVIVTYATPDDATVPGASDQYNMTGKRVLLLNAPSASQGTFEYLPEESAIITSTQYEMSPASLTTTTVEIDLTNVTYNGTVYLTFDYRDAENGQAATGFLVWVTGITLA